MLKRILAVFTAMLLTLATYAFAQELRDDHPTTYVVQKGDTLWEIAEKHYGKGKGAKYTEIVKANSPPVKDPDMIQPGWVLRIPPLA